MSVVTVLDGVVPAVTVAVETGWLSSENCTVPMGSGWPETNELSSSRLALYCRVVPLLIRVCVPSVSTRIDSGPTVSIPEVGLDVPPRLSTAVIVKAMFPACKGVPVMMAVAPFGVETDHCPLAGGKLMEKV